jgi:transcription elongation factor Elf1
MMEPDEDLKKFEEELKKPKTAGIKKDRIVTCPGCGKKQTVMQVKLGEEVKCRSCGNMFEVKKEMAQDAHLVTMAAVDLQVKQMELMQRVGRVPPPPKKKITVSTTTPTKPKGGSSGLRILLYLVIIVLVAIAVLLGLHFTKVFDLTPYLDKLKGLFGS